MYEPLFLNIHLAVTDKHYSVSKQSLKVNWENIDKEAFLSNKTVVIEDSTSNLQFSILNNPYQFDSSDLLLFYFGNQLSYIGQYSSLGSLTFKQIPEGKLIHCHLVIVRGNKMVSISNKRVFLWHRSTECLFIAYLPGNQETEKIIFIPGNDQLR